MSSNRIRLYKFTTVDAARCILSSQSLRFSPLQEFNDPFEGESVYHTVCDSSMHAIVCGLDGAKRTLEHKPNMQSVAKARECIADHAACCFSARFDSTLLWSHYADNHKGICIEFEFGQFPFNGWSGDLENVAADRPFLFREVTYSTQRPNLLVNTETNSVVPFEMIEQAVFTKSSDWSYEVEWRLVKRASSMPTYERFRGNRLKQVIFGMRCETADRSQIAKLIIDTYGADVTLSVARKHSHRYAIEIQPFSD